MIDDIDIMADGNDGTQELDPLMGVDEDLLGATVLPEINHSETGWNSHQGGVLLLNSLDSNVATGGFDIDKPQNDGNDADNMGNKLEGLALDLDAIRLPWSIGADDTDATSLVGTPEHDANYWQPQTTAFTCAVQAQRGIIEAFTGQSVSEAQLVYDATVNGWLTEGGMSPHDVGSLLELYGIPCHTRTGATVEELMAELAQGRKVIVGVDSGEVWRNDFPLEDFFQQSADHAIWVTGVDMSDSANPKVIVNDSGDPSGAGKAYDLTMFSDAWQDSGFFYVATDDAPSDMALASQQGFDQSEGTFSGLSSYFAGFSADLSDHLENVRDDPSLGALSEAPSMFTDSAVRAFVTNLAKSPMVSLDESSTDTLFRII